MSRRYLILCVCVVVNLHQCLARAATRGSRNWNHCTKRDSPRGELHTAVSGSHCWNPHDSWKQRMITLTGQHRHLMWCFFLYTHMHTVHTLYTNTHVRCADVVWREQSSPKRSRAVRVFMVQRWLRCRRLYCLRCSLMFWSSMSEFCSLIIYKQLLHNNSTMKSPSLNFCSSSLVKSGLTSSLLTITTCVELLAQHSYVHYALVLTFSQDLTIGCQTEL